jgi:hypothetical protein
MARALIELAAIMAVMTALLVGAAMRPGPLNDPISPDFHLTESGR